MERNREHEMNRIAQSVSAMIGPYVALDICWRKETEESLKDFTAWDRERLGLHSGGEFFYIRKNGELLYAVITNADSILTAAHELMELIANKF